MSEEADEWSWDIDLDALVGSFIKIETNESMYREGRLSAVKYRKMDFMGEVVTVLEGLEMNGDETDVIPFELIKRVDLV